MIGLSLVRVGAFDQLWVCGTSFVTASYRIAFENPTQNRIAREAYCGETYQRVHPFH